ncbi:MAG: hypothetical protein ACPLXO_02455 [Desulfurella sp.]
MEILLIGILTVLVLPYILQFVIKFKSNQSSDFLKSLGNCFSSGFDLFD